MIDLKHELCKLSTLISWNKFEASYSKNYSLTMGRPAKSIRLMVSLLILKQLYDVSDEDVVKQWTENPYWQYFSGEEYFQWKLPCDSTELVKFRNRIGIEGVEKIFQESIEIHGQAGMEVEIIADTTVQEKNITYPTDTKLHLKIIGRALRISKKEEIQVRQSYTRTVRKLRWATRYLRNPRRAREGRRAIRKIKTIAGRLLRELRRKMPTEKLEKYSKEIEIMERVLKQKRNDKDKVYSIHEPDVSCIAKGKDHKKYEFGSKVSILRTKDKGVIVGALSFKGNPYDGNTLEEALNQNERLRGMKAERVLVDEGYRGRSKIEETEVIRVHRPKPDKYSKRKWKNWFKRRSAVEATISHLKNDYGLDRNYLKGSIGDSINCMLAAAAMNFRLMILDILTLCRLFIIRFFFNLSFE
jgi:IS5 family transposase